MPEAFEGAVSILQALSALLVFLLGLGLLAVVVMYVIDVTQTSQTVRRNFPVIGPYAREPYEAKSIFNISAMSYGALSKPAVLALSNGARMAGIWLKPGKGGILPGEKVTAKIAAIRHIPEGEPSISPNRHPEIDTATDLLDMINHLRDVSGLPVGFKSVIGAYGWLDELFEEVLERGIESAPDFITVDSGDGGTGAAPMSLIDNTSA